MLQLVSILIHQEKSLSTHSVKQMNMGLMSVKQRSSVLILAWITIVLRSVFGWEIHAPFAKFKVTQASCTRLWIKIFRLTIMNTHGPEKSSHFWATEKKQQAPEARFVEVTDQRKGDERVNVEASTVIKECIRGRTTVSKRPSYTTDPVRPMVKFIKITVKEA